MNTINFISWTGYNWMIKYIWRDGKSSMENETLWSQMWWERCQNPCKTTTQQNILKE